jgi:hypothetical protein
MANESYIHMNCTASSEHEKQGKEFDTGRPFTWVGEIVHK